MLFMSPKNLRVKSSLQTVPGMCTGTKVHMRKAVQTTHRYVPGTPREGDSFHLQSQKGFPEASDLLKFKGREEKRSKAKSQDTAWVFNIQEFQSESKAQCGLCQDRRPRSSSQKDQKAKEGMGIFLERLNKDPKSR